MGTSRAGQAGPTSGARAVTASDVQRQTTAGRFLLAHPWIPHAALVTLVLLLGGFTALLVSDTVQGATALGLFLPGAPVHDVAVGAWLVGAAVGAAVLLARRWQPLAVTAVLTVLAVVSLRVASVLGVLGFCLAWALHAVAARYGARTTWATGATVLVVVTIALWRWQDIGLGEILLWSGGYTVPAADGTPVRQLIEPEFSAGRRSWTVMLLLTLLVLGGLTGAGVQGRRLHAHDLAQRYAALARERDTSAALARSAERARIAREMHDIAHSVSVMVALSDGAAAALDRAPDASRQALAELSNTGREALQDMRSVLASLQPAEPGDPERPTAPTETDLHTVVERFRAAGLPLTTSGLDTPLPPDTALRLAVVRIVTEALTNVLRHAAGTPSAALALRRNDTVVEVEILDAGGTRGRVDGGSQRGLLGMHERAALLGGRVEAGPEDAGGWRVRVELPTGTSQNGDDA